MYTFRAELKGAKMHEISKFETPQNSKNPPRVNRTLHVGHTSNMRQIDAIMIGLYRVYELYKNNFFGHSSLTDF